MTDKRTTRKAALEEIKGIQNGLKERNEIQREAISCDLSGLIDKLKKHVIDKQNKLDRYVDQLHHLTKDKVACGLLDALDFQLQDAEKEFSDIHKFESNDKTVSADPKNLGVMIEICSRLYQVISKLQTIENTVEEVMKKY